MPTGDKLQEYLTKPPQVWDSSLQQFARVAGVPYDIVNHPELAKYSVYPDAPITKGTNLLGATNDKDKLVTINTHTDTKNTLIHEIIHALAEAYDDDEEVVEGTTQLPGEKRWEMIRGLSKSGDKWRQIAKELENARH